MNILKSKQNEEQIRFLCEEVARSVAQHGALSFKWWTDEHLVNIRNRILDQLNDSNAPVAKLLLTRSGHGWNFAFEPTVDAFNLTSGNHDLFIK